MNGTEVKDLISAALMMPLFVFTGYTVNIITDDQTSKNLVCYGAVVAVASSAAMWGYARRINGVRRKPGKVWAVSTTVFTVLAVVGLLAIPFADVDRYLVVYALMIPCSALFWFRGSVTFDHMIEDEKRERAYRGIVSALPGPETVREMRENMAGN